MTSFLNFFVPTTIDYDYNINNKQNIIKMQQINFFFILY